MFKMELSEGNRVAGIGLYSGQDLSLAYSRSRFDPDTFPQPHRDARMSLSSLVSDVRNSRLRDQLPKRRIVVGTELASKQTMTLEFRGSTRAIRFLSRHILGSDDFTIISGREDIDGAPHILVCDYPVTSPFAKNRHSTLRIPRWIRQSRPIQSGWNETLASLSRSLRKEISRLLRKYSYCAELHRGEVAIRQYYRFALRPYLESRHTDDAILPSEESFIKSYRESYVLILTREGRAVAASVLSVRPRKVSIDNTALIDGIEFLPGRSDVLDYFTLLLAQLLELEIVDFGLSRPHIDDGVFRYKAKWGAIPSKIQQPKASIYLKIQYPHAATIGFLSRNTFVQQDARGLFVHALCTSSNNNLSTVARMIAQSGIDRAVLTRCTPVTAETQAIDTGFTSVKYCEKTESPLLEYLRNQ